MFTSAWRDVATDYEENEDIQMEPINKSLDDYNIMISLNLMNIQPQVNHYLKKQSKRKQTQKKKMNKVMMASNFKQYAA